MVFSLLKNLVLSYPFDFFPQGLVNPALLAIIIIPGTAINIFFRLFNYTRINRIIMNISNFCAANSGVYIILGWLSCCQNWYSEFLLFFSPASLKYFKHPFFSAFARMFFYDFYYFFTGVAPCHVSTLFSIIFLIIFILNLCDLYTVISL